MYDRYIITFNILVKSIFGIFRVEPRWNKLWFSRNVFFNDNRCQSCLNTAMYLYLLWFETNWLAWWENIQLVFQLSHQCPGKEASDASVKRRQRWMAACLSTHLRSMSTPWIQCTHYGAWHSLDIVPCPGMKKGKAATLCEVGQVCEGVNSGYVSRMMWFDNSHSLWTLRAPKKPVKGLQSLQLLLWSFVWH